MIDIKTGVFTSIDKCPICELILQQCVCKDENYFDINKHLK